MTLHAADRDPSVDPGTDFYRHANGGWLDSHPIPPGYGAWGSFEELNLRNEEVLRRVVERAASEPRDDVERMVGDFWTSGMDLDAIEAAGTEPLRPVLDVVAGITSGDDLLALLPRLHQDGLDVLLAGAVTVDHDDSTRHLVWLVPVGLGLPDRDSYLAEGEVPEALRSAYVDHVANQLRNVGVDSDEATRLAPEVLAFETRLAEHQLPAEERRDPSNTLNRHDLDELRALAPALDLPRYLVEAGMGEATSVNVQQPRYVAALHDVVATTPVDVLRAYATFQVVKATADALPQVFVDEAFDFYGRRVQGRQEPLDRWKRVLSAMTQDIGEAVSRLYVAETFPPAAKDRALAMVHEILEEMRESLRTRSWMSEGTRERGIVKLDAMGVKIGYPDLWRDWSGTGITRQPYVANRMAASRFDVARHNRRVTEPVDVHEWEMPPHIVNAYYHPVRNEIVFPAGILQPPFFDFDADDALNYGGIGSVIGHEVTHGFDDNGRRYDADGHFVDWWEADDQAHFVALADRLADQFSAYTAVADVKVNGRLTLGENIADLGGVELAQRAHARVSADQPEVDGLTPAQRFFLANATIWRGNVSEPYARTLAQMDPHSPRHLRVLGPLANSAAFQAAFDLPADAPMLRAPEERIEIW